MSMEYQWWEWRREIRKGSFPNTRSKCDSNPFRTRRRRRDLDKPLSRSCLRNREGRKKFASWAIRLFLVGAIGKIALILSYNLIIAPTWSGVTLPRIRGRVATHESLSRSRSLRCGNDKMGLRVLFWSTKRLLTENRRAWVLRIRR